MYGASYEGFIIEHLLAQLPRWQASFYRTSGGAELDLVLEKSGRTVAIEIKASTTPKLSRGNWSALDELQPDYRYIVAPVDTAYPLNHDVNVMPPDDILVDMIHHSIHP